MPIGPTNHRIGAHPQHAGPTSCVLCDRRQRNRTPYGVGLNQIHEPHCQPRFNRRIDQITRSLSSSPVSPDKLEVSMKSKTISTAVCSVLVCLVASAVTFAGQRQSKDYRDAVSQSEKAAQVFREIMRAPDKSVPRDILDDAECVAVFPQVLKAGFVFGARGGRGVASCRTKAGWSAPAFFNLKGGSVGLQIGAQSTDFVLLFMTQNGQQTDGRQGRGWRGCIGRRRSGRTPGRSFNQRPNGR